MSNSVEERGNKLRGSRAMRAIERAGNKMVQPITMFGILCLIVLVLSLLGGVFGWSATGEMYNKSTGAVENTTVYVFNLLSRDGITYILENFVKNVVEYAPLGVMLVMFVGIGLADGAGLFAVLLRKIVEHAPEKVLVPILMLVGVCGNLASSSMTLILVPLAGLIYLNYGKHPLAGMMGMLAAITSGFSANLILTDTDVVLASITQEAARIIDPNYVVTPVANYFFMVASAIFLALLCTFVTEKVIAPMLGPYDLSEAGEDLSELTMNEITDKENKAFKAAMYTLLAMIIVLVICCIPANSIFRNPETGSLIMNSLLMKALVPILALLFFVPALVFGYRSGVFTSERDVVNMIYKSYGKLVSVFAIALTAGQFMRWFGKSNLGTVLAFKGADFLSKLDINYILLLVIFIIFSGLINILMNSGTAKWYIFAPVFIPMMMKLGISPELTQLAYRIGDSCTNAVTPLNSFLPVILLFMQRYKKDAGIGTYVATLLPYTLYFLVAWVIFFVLWMLLGIPIGPGATLFFAM